MLVGKGLGGLGFSFAPLNKLLRHTPNKDTWLDTKVVFSKHVNEYSQVIVVSIPLGGHSLTIH
jgi:hypothetical protein